MAKKNGVAYSETTTLKQMEFISIITMLCDIWRGTTKSYGANSMVYYYDLNAGPGISLDCPITGSPVLAAKALKHSGLPHRAYVCDNNRKLVDDLEEALIGYVNFTPICGDNGTVLLPYLPEEGYSNYGLIYADPFGYPRSEFLFMNKVAQNPHCQKMDLLLSIGANTIRRVSRAYPDYSSLMGLIDDIYSFKSVVFIRESLPETKRGVKHWTFVIATNWSGFPLPSGTFHDVKTPEGMAILEELSYTASEKTERNRANGTGFYQASLF